MNPTVERIINQCNSKERLECVEKLDNEIDLYSLMENYIGMTGLKYLILSLLIRNVI